MRGLKNLGNTCYFNAAVQCLAHVPTLAHHLLLNDYTGLCSITFEYQKVLRSLLVKGDDSPVDPIELLGAFRERFPEFEERKQHDSQEVVLKLMDVFEKSIGLTVFNGREAGQLMTSLLLPVLEPCSLGDLLEGHAVEEWPQVISFTFVMYDHKFPVVLPFQFMDKNLFAVIMHKGDAVEGHYALLVKVHNTWYIKEDAHVYEIPYQIELMRGEFYMAFYRPDKLLR